MALAEDLLKIKVYDSSITVHQIRRLGNKKLHRLSLRLKELDYETFLKTQYWKTVSNYAKELCGNKCSVCGSSKELNVHHRTYENHGNEVNHLEDLVVMCKNCHGKVHNGEQLPFVSVSNFIDKDSVIVKKKKDDLELDFIKFCNDIYSKYGIGCFTNLNESEQKLLNNYIDNLGICKRKIYPTQSKLLPKRVDIAGNIIN